METQDPVAAYLATKQKPTTEDDPVAAYLATKKQPPKFDPATTRHDGVPFVNAKPDEPTTAEQVGGVAGSLGRFIAPDEMATVRSAVRDPKRTIVDLVKGAVPRSPKEAIMSVVGGPMGLNSIMSRSMERAPSVQQAREEIEGAESTLPFGASTALGAVGALAAAGPALKSAGRPAAIKGLKLMEGALSPRVALRGMRTRLEGGGKSVADGVPAVPGLQSPFADMAETAASASVKTGPSVGPQASFLERLNPKSDPVVEAIIKGTGRRVPKSKPAAPEVQAPSRQPLYDSYNAEAKASDAARELEAPKSSVVEAVKKPRKQQGQSVHSLNQRAQLVGGDQTLESKLAQSTQLQQFMKSQGKSAEEIREMERMLQRPENGLFRSQIADMLRAGRP